MSSRDKILQSIKQNKPLSLPLPQAYFAEGATGSLLSAFAEKLLSIGGTFYVIDTLEPVVQFWQEQKKLGSFIINCMDTDDKAAYANRGAATLNSVHYTIIRGVLGVAENAAIWITENEMGNRLLPFITENLVLVIDEQSIVSNMHQAYKSIDVNQHDYGVFIAGPSKTADIEQSLVIGAHGPISLQVFILKA